MSRSRTCESAPGSPGLCVHAIVIGALAIDVVLLGWSALEHSPTWDEVGHLPAGVSHWRFQRFELYRVNPPLVRMVAALPVLFVDAKHIWWRFSDELGSRS